MSAHRKAWAFYDAVEAHSGGCQVCGDNDEFSPDVEAFEETGEILCSLCWEAEQDRCEQARMHREEAEDRRRDNPLEPDFRRLGQ
jgi:hypothetical protein